MRIKPYPTWLYFVILLLWAATVAISASFGTKLFLNKAEADFQQQVEDLDDRMRRITSDNQAILEGFSAFLGAIEYADRESASRYAQRVLARYPQVIALQVVRGVRRKDLTRFVARQKSSGLPNFRVRAFSFQSSRTWRKIGRKTWYYPVIFIEPNPPKNMSVVGLDTDSVPFLREAMTKSADLKTSVATVPFRLIDGAQAYALFRPVIERQATSNNDPAFTELVVSTDAIRKQLAGSTVNLDLRVDHGGFSSGTGQSPLFHIEAPAPTPLEAWLLPQLTGDRRVHDIGQPFVLRIRKQLRWSDLDAPLAVAMASASVLSLGVVLLFLRHHALIERERRRNERHLLHLALHDPLTGLPNRTLLEDRFVQSCSRSQRLNTPFAALFLDVDDFKHVNDAYGHDVGDRLLQTISARLKECIRDADTVARISGDEFVIILEGASAENAERVVQKIRARLAQPVAIQGVELRTQLSIGVAAYPMDGRSMDDLLEKADERMYAAKSRSKAAIRDDAKPVTHVRPLWLNGTQAVGNCSPREAGYRHG